jgi:hypothetical protein
MADQTDEADTHLLGETIHFGHGNKQPKNLEKRFVWPQTRADKLGIALLLVVLCAEFPETPTALFPFRAELD